MNSGDTIPTKALARAGENATILIHEATFADDKTNMAREKKHSTVGQALQAADDMQAWRVIVTHLSQRYSKYMPELRTCVGGKELASGARASAAFDGMCVRFSMLPFLPALTPALNAFMGEIACEAAEAAAQEST